MNVPGICSNCRHRRSALMASNLHSGVNIQEVPSRNWWIRKLPNVITLEVSRRELVLMGKIFQVGSLQQKTLPTGCALPARLWKREPRPDRKLRSMSLLLGIIVLRLRGPPYVLCPSYQLDIASLHTLLDVSPSQHPDVSSIQLNCSCSLFSLHLYLSRVS